MKINTFPCSLYKQALTSFLTTTNIKCCRTKTFALAKQVRVFRYGTSGKLTEFYHYKTFILHLLFLLKCNLRFIGSYDSITYQGILMISSNVTLNIRRGSLPLGYIVLLTLLIILILLIMSLDTTILHNRSISYWVLRKPRA